MDIAQFKNLSELDAGNPLLAKLPPEMSFAEWSEKLLSDPRQTWEKPYPYPPLESHIDSISDLFVPVRQTIALAVSLYSMLLASLRRRDPRIEANRRRIFDRSRDIDWHEIDANFRKLPNFTPKAKGMMLLGPTGVSKTHALNNILSHLPQVIVHGPNEEYGWHYLKQLVHLRVELPNDARESSLYHHIADAMDRVLGSDYGVQVRVPRMKVPDKQSKVIDWLLLHRCGALILEELQEKQTSPAVLGKEFAGAFLKITNEGIPLVVVGNPLAFEHILDFTQDVGRLTPGGRFEMVPAFDHTDEAWNEDLVPGIWGWKCFDEKDEIVPNLARVLYERTGGIPKFLSVYRCATLKEAVRSGARRVTQEHMDNAYFSEEMIGLHYIIDAYVTKDKARFDKMRDQPYAFLNIVWGRKKAKDTWMKAQRVSAADVHKNAMRLG
jgi:hypothetical protein